MSTLGPNGEIQDEFQHDGDVHRDRTEYVREWRSTHPEHLPKAAAQSRKWLSNHREYKHEYQREYYREHYQDKREYSRVYRYGLSNEDYQQLLDSQQGRCAICRKTPEEANKGRDLYIDHNHITGKVRGLVCQRCNLAVGSIEYEYINQVQKYLEES